MAHQIAPLYNLKGSVGKDGKNFVEDVRLVQALLKIIVENSGPAFWTQVAKTYNKTRPTEASPAVNGNYDNALRLWIDLVIAFYSKVGFNLTEDGRVDPLPEKHAMSADTHAGSRARNLYLLCTQAAACSTSKYLEIGNAQGLMYSLLPGAHVDR